MGTCFEGGGFPMICASGRVPSQRPGLIDQMQMRHIGRKRANAAPLRAQSNRGRRPIWISFALLFGRTVQSEGRNGLDCRIRSNWPLAQLDVGIGLKRQGSSFPPR